MAGPARDVGWVDYSSTSSSGFIPQIWAGKGVEKFYSSTVFGEIASTDYEGEISSMGDKVIIRTTPSIAIADYVIGAGLTYEKPTSPKVELNIDKAKSFAFELNEVDKHQSDRNLIEEWSDDAGQQMKIAIDTDVLGSIYADVAAENQGATAGAISGNINLGATGTPVLLTEANVIGAILDVGQAMDEQSIPETGRWITLPAWACRLIKGSDLKDASISGDGTSILRNGRIGMIDRFTIYNSNQVAHVVDGANNAAHCVAGHKAGLTFASQMVEMERVPNPNDFGHLVRGLNVYGYKVVEGSYLFDLYAAKG